MSITRDFLAAAERIAAAQPLPAVAGLYFPPPQTDTSEDHFGFVFLDSGDVGAFYVSLDDTLAELWRDYPRPDTASGPLRDWLARLESDSQTERALGLGAWNALGQWLMRRAGYAPGKRRRDSNASIDASGGGTVGMVGYFGPLVERLVAQGQRVLVLERRLQRIAPQPLVQGTADPAALAACSEVLCTASTLINDSLDEILAACRGVAKFSLIGPSAAGLPDALFARGVHSVGATRFAGRQHLLDTLAAGESWGRAGDKYEIDSGDYPGLDALLARAVGN